MIIKTSREEIEEYENSRASGEVITQSRLKLLPLGVRAFNAVETEKEASLYFEEKGYQLVGSGVDCILTESREEFNNRYHMSDCIKPSDKIMSIVQRVFDARMLEYGPENMPETLGDADLSVWLTIAIEAENYQSKWKIDTRVAKVITEGNAYYQSLVNAVGKTVLDLDQSHVINSIVDSIQRNAQTRRYFMEEFCPEHIDIYQQKIIVVTYKEITIAMLLDILEVNHHDKTIRVVDFKTLHGFPISFPNSVRQYRYDFQVVLYTLGVDIWKKTQPGLENYTVLKPGFIVETTTINGQGQPLIYNMTAQAVRIAIHGIEQVEAFTLGNQVPETVQMRTKKIWGINETIDLYKWHLENGFDQDRVVKENLGVLNLNWEGIAHENPA